MSHHAHQESMERREEDRLEEKQEIIETVCLNREEEEQEKITRLSKITFKKNPYNLDLQILMQDAIYKGE